MKNIITKKAKDLLIDLIKTQSFSGEEQETGDLIQAFLDKEQIEYKRQDNNIFAFNHYFDPDKPSILLNSHHDTVKPNKGYSKNPFDGHIEDGKIFGLGSNDAGGCLVSLISCFIHFYKRKDLKYNLILLASAEEENSGELGIRSVIPVLPEIDFAIVGEPTQMNLAIAEKGLMVLDCYAHGPTGHAAHSTGENSIYKALQAVQWFKSYQFKRISETLGNTKMTVTQIEAGNQHNVVPAICHLVVDIRINDLYSNQEVLDIVEKNVEIEVKARSTRLNSSRIDKKHEIVQAGIAMGRSIYGSPTLSDQSNLSCPSLKLGPGDSLRSHTADEFIFENEIDEGIEIYIELLSSIM